MNLDITKRRDDGSDSHSPVQHTEEQDREIQVTVSPPAITLRPIPKPHTPIVTEPRSPSRVPAPTNKIRAAMASSPSSPQSPEHPIKEYSIKSGTSTIEVPDTHKAGDPSITPTTPTTVNPAPKTRRNKRAPTCEFEQNQQPNNDGNPKPTNTQQGDNKLQLQLDANQLANITTTNNPTGEQCLPIFSAIALKQKRCMLFAPMDFQHFSIDALIDSGALVNCMPEKEYQKLKNMSPANILKESDPPPFKLQVANGDKETPTRIIQIQFEIGDWTSKETFIVASKITGLILGLTFLKSNSAILDASQGLLHFPHLTYAINPVSDEQPTKTHKVTILNRTTLAPDQCITVEASVNIRSIADTTGVIHQYQPSRKINQ